MTTPTLVPMNGMAPAGSTGQGGLVAEAGGLQADATLLPAFINRVETVAGAGDGVMLPSAIPGTLCIVINATATAMQVFGQPTNAMLQTQVAGGDSIAAADSSTQTSGATGISVAANVLTLFACAVVGQWKQGLCVS